jgi:hypothetical protein
VPVFSHQLGKITGYILNDDVSPGFIPHGPTPKAIAVKGKSNCLPVMKTEHHSLPYLGSSKSAIQQSGEILYKKTADGQFIPFDLSTHTESTNIGNPFPSKECESDAMEWDGWPDGDFCRNFAWEELEATKNLRSHWSYKANGGYRNGDELSLNWERGKKTSRRCMGVMLCDNHPACGIITRPQTTAKGIDAQLQKGCECGAHLIHQECPVRSFLWQWSGGIYYQNGGDHEHKRPTHLLHLLPKEEARFQALVRTHPTSGPHALITGVPTFEGPGESVAEISDVLLNVDRVSKERAKLKHGIGESGDNFLESFAKFEEEHPDFIILSRLGKYTVISTQTAFMCSQLVKDYILDGPLNGMVSDAAHGFWKDRKALLMVSSTYSPVLHCWVPGVVSYTNGASTNHFAAHFLAVLQSITREAEGRNISVTDDLFKNVSSHFDNYFMNSYTSSIDYGF